MLVRSSLPALVNPGLVMARPNQFAMIQRMRRPVGLAGGEQVVMSSASISGATLSAAAGLHVGWATAAIPIVGPIIAGVTIALSLLMARKGPKQKVATTKIVDAVEPQLVKNLNGYMALPVHYASAQAQALANFDAGWQYVVDHCNIPEMGEPGERCTNERKAGACKWKNAEGVCFNWFAAYRDPIANDPDVKPDPSAAETLAASLGLAPGSSSAGGLLPLLVGADGGLDLSGLLLPAALLLAAVVL